MSGMGNSQSFQLFEKLQMAPPPTSGSFFLFSHLKASSILLRWFLTPAMGQGWRGKEEGREEMLGSGKVLIGLMLLHRMVLS